MDISCRSRLPRSPDFELFRTSGDPQHTSVMRLMTGRARQYEIRRTVAATIRAMDQVMELQSSPRAAAWHSATTAIATPHEARDARWNVLVRSFRRGVVERSDVLGIAHCAVDRRGFDRDLCAGAFLPALTAALAHGDRDLKLGAAGELGRRSAVEHRAA